MIATIRGASLNTLTRVYSPEEFRRNPDGTVNTYIVFAIRKSKLTQNLPRRGVDRHPDLTDFYCDDWSTRDGKGGISLLRVDYISILTEAIPDGTTLPPDADLEAVNTAVEVPVASLPWFLQDRTAEQTYDGIARTAMVTLRNNADSADVAWPTKDFGSPWGVRPITVDPTTGAWPKDGGGLACRATNGAIFDTYGQNKTPTAADYNPNVGRFLYFAPGSPFVGLESVLLPRGEWAYSYASLTMPSLANVGRIGQPAGLPVAAAPLNYLLAQRNVRRSGLIHRVSDQWLRSGPNGWNTRVYPTATP